MATNGQPTKPTRQPAPFTPLAVVGMECRLPGAGNLREFEQLLFEGRSGIGPMPADRFDRSLYHDPRKGQPGMSYTQLGGCVTERKPDLSLLGMTADQAALIDPVHLNFCQVAIHAWLNAGFKKQDPQWRRTGVFVGHSGATKFGGCLNLASHIDEGLDFLNDVPAFQKLPSSVRQQAMSEVAARIRVGRPTRAAGKLPRYSGYTAASLPAEILGFLGPRHVCDAACASSLFAMQQAALAIQMGRLDAAIVGGATTNGVDNLILFSQSQACSDSGSRPFDQGANGLISSEGYAAVVIVPVATAQRLKLPILGVITGLGTASDGRGKSLWAPRAEGQQLAIRRAYAADAPLAIDYLEAHATSTQLGDATELHAVQSILSESQRSEALLIGSAKSNLGHTLETAGVAGLVKLLLSLKRRELPPSLSFESPNQNFDWSKKSIRVVDRRRAWSPVGKFRRAAVSAFGIGGLNAHLTVAESGATAEARVTTVAPAHDRIAIIGRGVVLPGAHQLSDFKKLLHSGKSMIGAAPAERWRHNVNIDPNTSRPFSTPTSNGGYIRNYVFDAQPYRIPPKQVKQSNPIQMMLLDAVTQAIGEADGGKWNFDRQRTGVVIGTVFGGDFGTELQLGLRIPEITRELTKSLQAKGVPAAQIAELAKEFRQRVLAARPALLDETGSFTASTLASRVAKTFDLMGGACAIDVDDASGLAGLNLAMDQLRSGNWDVAICGGAERCMDLTKFEQLSLTGKLVRSGRPEDVPEDCSRILPGEGVVILLLRRLSDAVAAGDRILGILDEFEISAVGTAKPTQDAALVRQIGYLTGAQGLVRLVKQTVQWEQVSLTAIDTAATIESHTEDGLKYFVHCSPPACLEKPAVATPTAPVLIPPPGPRTPSSTPAPAARKTVLNLGETAPVISHPEIVRNGRSTHTVAIGTALRAFRFGAASQAEFGSVLEAALADVPSAFGNGAAAFDARHACRLVVLADSAQTLATRLKAMLRQWQLGRRTGVFETERAILWQTRPHAVRTAWVFPGQGSQYAGQPSGMQADSAIETALQAIDAELVRQRLAPLTPQLTSPQASLSDIWWNQIWVLGLSLAFTNELRQRCGRPDVVLGHSFGEYSALVAAGAITIPQAIRMVKSRADAVTMTVREPGQLISVRGTPSAVDAALRDARLPAITTHYNAPQQTVIATAVDQVELVRKQLNAANLASVVVPVPVAYHTPRLAQAESLLAQSFANERFLPTSCAFLSTTSARYLAEPTELRASLVSQMTRPVLYVPAIERLLADDVAVLIEVGPNNVLSRLNHEIAGDRALCLSLDVPGREHDERLQLLDLVQEIIAPTPGVLREAVSTAIETTSITSTPAATNGRNHAAPQPAAEIEIVDLRRSAAKHRDTLPTPAPRQTAPPAAKPNPAPAHFEPVLAELSSAVSVEELRSFLMTVVVDLTGYSPEVIDFDADLEADLGVDSIKKAQVVGEMAEQYSLSVAPSGVKLGDLKTLGDIAALGAEILSSSPAAPAVTSAPAFVESIEIEVPEPVSAPVGFDLESIERFLIDLVVDQTGYSPDVVDLDADMEADLGIDSIKQAQLLGEVQQQFELQTVATERVSLSSFSTLRSILNFLAEQLPQSGVASFRVAVPEVEQNGSTIDALKKNAGERREERTPDLVAKSASGLRGSAAVDVVPDDWKALFGASSDMGSGWQSGLKRGQAHKANIRAALRLLNDTQTATLDVPELSSDLEEELAGLATGAEVTYSSVRAAYARLMPGPKQPAARKPATGPGPRPDANGRNGDSSHTRAVPKSITSQNLSGHVPPSPTESGRYLLRVVPAPRREGMPETPRITGPGLVIGNNAYAEAIVRKFEQSGYPCERLPAVKTLTELDARLAEIWAKSPTPHLFITTSHDADALTALDAVGWQQRRFAALETPYRVCQLWMQRTIDENRMDGGSVVLLTNLGGDFGFSGQTAVSPEGGLAGLIKAMLIECWMRGFRATPMKVIDIAPQTTPQQAVAGVWGEMAVPSYDMEVAFHGDERFAVQPIHRPLFAPGQLQPAPKNGHAQIRRGGVWVVTGGARGITSVVVRELAKRHGLKLHLVGTAPVPALTDAVREAAKENRLQLRREVMRQANLKNQNGMEAWRNVEKSIEIDATLQLMHSEGISAVYHSCDVSRLDDLQQTLQQIRKLDGKIDGVIHGAGIGQDARFDRKRPDKVDQCLRAKIDGCLNLMDATRGDRLDWFVSFGSISGRFGANGHTDYSLANDSLAKLTDRYRQERPEVRSVTFHWHAWGDIGMATKPETKLALEMINLEFMPAAEGLSHFLHELEHGGQEPEVLITDRAYFRKFFPVDRLQTGAAAQQRELATFPLLDSEQSGLPASGPVSLLLNPVKERFLNQHLVQGKPTLPFVVALELLSEAARRCAPGQDVLEVRNLTALQAIKFATEAPLELRVLGDRQPDGTIQCVLNADITRRDGRLVAKDRTYFEGMFLTGAARLTERVAKPNLAGLEWEPISYLPSEAPIYHGPDLQCLQQFAMSSETGYGLISASSTVQLGGGNRPTFGWSIHCVVMDACLYAAAVFAGRKSGKPSLPVSFEQVRLGRLADPGEACVIVIQQIAEEASGLVLAFQLIGLNGDLLLDVNGYRVGWLS
ncbi:type I polyketide synthase [Planctomicrobium piriforme]|uniref:Phosphopantetheine attachment site n=1 Tax=Planctomicrobium piriforme TaxID=1576369 RepID=A0A1I3DBG2_9PLAN|nr:type I polyketide synthase [Planctomicrobium piriforme]SFH84043.1 Phosphopantetheine attachment site [Planctomicrobium piriforme]